MRVHSSRLATILNHKQNFCSVDSWAHPGFDSPLWGVSNKNILIVGKPGDEPHSGLRGDSWLDINQESVGISEGPAYVPTVLPTVGP